MKARRLFWQACCQNLDQSWFNQDFGDLHLDSRQLVLGDVFIALPGARHDGRAFIAQALKQGVSAIVQESEVSAWHEHDGVLYLDVPHLEARLGELASLYYQHPSQQLQLHAITGTNGKTSCSHFLAQALSLLGYKTAVIGTLGAGMLGQLSPLINTTPDAVSLQRLLAHFVEQGVQHVTLEASSIALVQGRLQGCQIASALFTNLTRDHLDYHGDMLTYGSAKALLFAEPSLQRAILNDGDPFSAICAAAVTPHVKVLGFALTDDPSATTLSATLLPQRVAAQGVSAQLHYQDQSVVLHSALMGAFNIQNLLAVAATLLDLGVAFALLPELLAKITAVAGRLQCIQVEHKPRVVVDYAHTPAALAEALVSLRPYVTGRLWCIFGCGGDRDAGKRSVMGALAAQGADKLIITNDNPRFEDPAVIAMAIEQGIAKGCDYEIILDRAAAIGYAIENARAEDVILIAGKGHENYQQIGAVNYPFDDILVARSLFNIMKGV